MLFDTHYTPDMTFNERSVTRKQEIMMTSSNANVFRVTGSLYGEFTGDWWIPLTKASNAELWCFLWSAPEQTIE